MTTTTVHYVFVKDNPALNVTKCGKKMNKYGMRGTQDISKVTCKNCLK